MTPVAFTLAIVLLTPTLAMADCTNVAGWRLCEGQAPMFIPSYLRSEPKPEVKRPYSYELRTDDYQATYGTRQQTWRFRDSEGRRGKGSVLSLPSGRVSTEGNGGEQ